MKPFSIVLSVLILAGCGGNPEPEPPSDAELTARAQQLAQDLIIVDTHIDVPYRLTEEWADVTQATEGGDFDYPRATKGGLDAPFMSIYIPASRQDEDGMPAAFADSLIDMVVGITQTAPEKFAMATTPYEVEMHHAVGIMSLAMGMENGAPITDTEKLQHFFDRGIRYVTLTHSRDNHISDSSYDTTHTWNGLSEFGEELIPAMNRVGMMVDISHVTDSAFYDVMRITRAPAIASHSSCRHFTPGFERNMSDDMIRALAENGGVIMINFGSSFLTAESRAYGDSARTVIQTYLAENGLEWGSEEAEAYVEQWRAENPFPFADVSDVVDHIDRVVELVGIDHVGLGSDYDGVGDSLPTGLKDVSEYPNLIKVLLERGYSESDIEKVLGGNILRVWTEVEAIAQALRAQA